VEVEVGQERFEYATIDSASATMANANKQDWAVKASVGCVERHGFYIGVGVTYEQVYKAPDEIDFVIPNRMNSDIFEHHKLHAWSPALQTNQLFDLEVRKLIGSHVGLNPRATWRVGDRARAGQSSAHIFSEVA
jgi:hypothetical protein